MIMVYMRHCDRAGHEHEPRAHPPQGELRSLGVVITVANVTSHLCVRLLKRLVARPRSADAYGNLLALIDVPDQGLRSQGAGARYGQVTPNAARTSSDRTPSMRTRLLLLVSPETMRTRLRATPTRSARNSTRAWFARPATGGAATRTLISSPCRPASSVRRALGWTRIAISTAADRERTGSLTGSRGSDLARGRAG